MGSPRAVVAGLGKTGHSVIRHLLARGWQVTATDTRTKPPGIDGLRAMAPGLRIALGGLDVGLLTDVDYVVASPGLSQSDPFFIAARSLGVPVIGDIELFARSGAQRVVGITGTNGKSTVTSLVALMGQRAGLAARAGGNLAPPALDLLEGAPADLYVLELSSYQLETTFSLQLAAAAVLNVTPDHLDRYADVESYAAAKARIYERCETAVVNVDDARVAAMVRPGQRASSFSLRGDSGADYVLVTEGGREWLCARGEKLLAVDELRIVGHHNAANALAALALGDALGLARAAMLGALREFPGLPHRAAWVADVRGVRYVNDSKGTNVGATLAAVAGFPGPLLLIVGGDGKNQDFTPLRAAFAGKVRRVLLIGRDAPTIAAALDGVCGLERCDSLEAAVVAAARAAQPGDTVLLSPACASLDMFRDYGHRGEVFADAVRRLAA
ncbi:MAG TPA: UDP-N-acetylmuramoyl-L-alanine--D-glutamate ligase [Steroidobacteraceae bacterium]|nr:UDP-N-acetylmuramoyl-L-alanine--D-glutamate ligase [Steroidobacteraceae bacterium]